MSVIVRSATLDDAPAIAALNKIVTAKHVAAEPAIFKDVKIDAGFITSLLNSKDNALFIAHVDDDPASYIYGQVRKFPETSLTFAYTALHVHHICVDERFRRRGIGKALFKTAREDTAQHAIDRVTADIWSFNEEASGFFTQAGLTPYMARLWQPFDG